MLAAWLQHHLRAFRGRRFQPNAKLQTGWRHCQHHWSFGKLGSRSPARSHRPRSFPNLTRRQRASGPTHLLPRFPDSSPARLEFVASQRRHDAGNPSVPTRHLQRILQTGACASRTGMVERNPTSSRGTCRRTPRGPARERSRNHPRWPEL